MATRQQTVEDVRRIVAKAATESGLAPIAEYLALGLRDIDRYSPRRVKTILAGDGTDEYLLGDDWHVGFSTIDRIRWVADADFNAPAVWLTADQYEVEFARTVVTTEAVGTGDGSTKSFDLDEDYAVQKDAAVTVNAVAVTAYTIEGNRDGSRITFTTAPTNGHAIVATYYVTPPQIRFAISPATGDRVVIEHSSRHALSDSAASCTLTDTQAAALAQRAAAYLLRAASASVIGTKPMNTDTDFISPAIQSAGDAYRRLADDADAAFDNLLGIDRSPGAERRGVPVIVSVPATPNAANRGYLTHPRRWA